MKNGDYLTDCEVTFWTKCDRNRSTALSEALRSMEMEVRIFSYFYNQ